MPKKITVTVPTNSKPMRFDVALHEMGILPSRSQAKRLIEDGAVKLNGAVHRPGRIVKDGDLIEVFIPDPIPAKPQSEDIPLKIIYEDSDIVVVDKPAGMVTHPAAGNYTGTLVNAILYHCSDLSSICGVTRPGIVHRLDKDTSGVIVVAKNDMAHQSLAKQFHDRLVEKTYMAIVIGRMSQPVGEIVSAIARNPAHRVKMKGGKPDGRHAATRWKEIEYFAGASLLELKPLTGRTHQIRVHLAEAKRPIVADKLYGSKNILKNVLNPLVRGALGKLKRQALHAHKLTINHPRTGDRMTFESPIPEDMLKAIEELRIATQKA